MLCILLLSPYLSIQQLPAFDNTSNNNLLILFLDSQDRVYA